MLDSMQSTTHHGSIFPRTIEGEDTVTMILTLSSFENFTFRLARLLAVLGSRRYGFCAACVRYLLICI